MMHFIGINDNQTERKLFVLLIKINFLKLLTRSYFFIVINFLTY